METLRIENLKIRKDGHKEFMEVVSNAIERINLYITKKGMVPENRKNQLQVIEFAMENEVSMIALNRAMTICDDDLQKALSLLSK